MNYENHIDAENSVQSEIVFGNVVNKMNERYEFEIYESKAGFWGGFGLEKDY